MGIRCSRLWYSTARGWRARETEPQHGTPHHPGSAGGARVSDGSLGSRTENVSEPGAIIRESRRGICQDVLVGFHSWQRSGYLRDAT